MPISENIKILRTKYNLSQKDLALIAGVSDKAVSTWERGTKEPRMGVIQKIADHFGLMKSNLIEDDGMKGIESPFNTISKSSTPFQWSNEEEKMIKKYRCLPPEVQVTVKTLIDIQYEAVKPVKSETAG